MTEPLPPYFDELSERSIYIPEALKEPAHTQQFLIKHRNNRITEFFIPTHELLARIDAADPDAMRAYLRETAPEVIADLYRPEIPEADSPEDVDEKPGGTAHRPYTEADRMGINVLALIDDMHLAADLIASLKRRREGLDLTITRRLDWVAAQLEAMGDRATDVLEYIDRTAQCVHGEDRTR